MLQNLQEADRIQFLTDILTCIGDGLIVTNCSGSVLNINSAGEKLTGWSEKEAAGMPFDEIFPLADYFSGERLDGPIRNALEYRNPVGLQNRSALITRDGKLRFVSASCSPIYSRDGKAQGVVVVFRDIDRIKNIEEEIRKEKDNLKNVLEALPTGIMLIGSDAVVRWVNKPLLELFQIQETNIVGQRFGDGSHCIYSYEKGCGEGERCRFCEIRQNISKVFQESTSQKDIVLWRSFISGNDENSLWLKVNFIPLAPSDETQIVVAIEDITEQKNHETALQRSRDEAESANRVKSEFIANMSHEIRTPLNGLIGMMDLLLLTEIGADQMEYIRMAKISANTLLKVISDILEFSRIEAGKISIAHASFDMKALMGDIVKIHAALAERKGLEFRYDFSPDIPQYMLGDPDRLRQILNNLIGNAIKFTDMGTVTVIVRYIAAAGKNISLEFRVSDTGIGISAEKMDLLFKRFSQVDGSVTRRHSGTGLGLAICKQLAELMGGAIHAESETGKGSTFRLTMVFAPGSETSPNALHGSAPEPEPVLPSIVMDDGELNRLMPEKAASMTERIVLLESQADSERCSRIRLGENGEIILGKAAEPAAVGDMSLELDELNKSLRSLKTILRENQLSLIEETAHRVKKTALRMDTDELANLAFKAELSSRKGNWDEAIEYCVMMINEINFRYKEG